MNLLNANCASFISSGSVFDCSRFCLVSLRSSCSRLASTLARLASSALDQQSYPQTACSGLVGVYEVRQTWQRFVLAGD